jgi:hypothetical protein
MPFKIPNKFLPFLIRTDYISHEEESYRFKFENNYGASVIRGFYSYGGNQGLYELAVLYEDDITYNTEITNDVEGYLTGKEVVKLLNQIIKLK